MRVATGILLIAFAARAQFRTDVPLVVAPTTITNREGRYVDGLGADDLILYDNNVPQRIQADAAVNPISLVVAVQASSNAAAVLDKLGRSGILFSQLLAGDAGETALITFSSDVRLMQDFTSDPDLLTRALRTLRTQGGGGAALDGVMEALRILARRKPDRRRIILAIAEKRDRSSRVQLPALLQEVQRQNAAIYWLTYSPFLTPFTNRPKKDQKGEPLPPEISSGSLLTILTELKQRAKANVADLLSRTSGGRTLGFLKQGALEQAIEAIGEEVHKQYILSFQPAPSVPGQFHSIRVEVKGRPDLRIRTRAGYWTIP
jgi:VWFA-related protein